MKLNPNFNIEFPSNPKWFKTIRNLILLSSKNVGFTHQQASQVSLAMDEWFANIHIHGYKKSLEGRIRIEFVAYYQPIPNISITVIDDGRQVSINQIKSRDLAEIRPGGLGIHLIKTIMDESLWSYSNKGMRLDVKKRASNILGPNRFGK